MKEGNMEYLEYGGNLWQFDSKEGSLSVVSKEEVVLDGEVIIRKHERSFIIGCTNEQWNQSKINCVEHADYEYREEMHWLDKEIEEEMNLYFK